MALNEEGTAEIQHMNTIQLSLAVQSGLHPAGLSKIERGVRCTQHTAQRIAAALNADVKEVFPDFDTYRTGGAQ